MVIVITRTHWIICAILFAIQSLGIIFTSLRSSICIFPIFLFPTVFLYAACTAFVTSLILMSYVKVFKRKGRS